MSYLLKRPSSSDWAQTGYLHNSLDKKKTPLSFGEFLLSDRTVCPNGQFGQANRLFSTKSSPGMTGNHPPGGSVKPERLLYFGASRRQNDHTNYRSLVVLHFDQHQSLARHGRHAGPGDDGSTMMLAIRPCLPGLYSIAHHSQFTTHYV